jgi:hypothetical protein
MRRKPEAERTDLTRNWGRLLLFYGISFLVIQLAGNLSDSELAVAIAWSVSFGIMGVACVLNAVRCGRVHCWFTGPWFLLTATVTVLRYLNVTTIPWPMIVNGGLLGALFLYFATEKIWGKYFNPRR